MQQPRNIDPEEWARFNEWIAAGGPRVVVIEALMETEEQDMREELAERLERMGEE